MVGDRKKRKRRKAAAPMPLPPPVQVSPNTLVILDEHLKAQLSLIQRHEEYLNGDKSTPGLRKDVDELKTWKAQAFAVVGALSLFTSVVWAISNSKVAERLERIEKAVVQHGTKP